MRAIQIYDTTLRDGTQGEGVSLSLQDKLQITQRLDEIGVDFVEGGYPLSNEKDSEYFQRVQQLGLKHVKVCAFGMTRRRGVKAEDDPGMKALILSGGATVIEVDVGHAARQGASRYSPLRLTRLALHVLAGFWPQPIQWAGVILGFVCTLAATALGIYALWALLHDDSKGLFDH